MSKVHDITRARSLSRKSSKLSKTEVRSRARDGVIDDETIRLSKKARKALLIRYVALSVLVAQFSSHILVMSYANTVPNRQRYSKSAVVLCTEIIKLVVTAILYLISAKSLKKFARGIRYHFVYDFFDTIKVGVPAVIYTIQNYLLYFALEHIDGTTYMVTYQSKTLTTAIFSVLLLKRKLSAPQWTALFIMFLGVAIVIVEKETTKHHELALNLTHISLNETSEQLNATSVFGSIAVTSSNNLTAHYVHLSPMADFGIGILAVFAACVLSGFAGVYFEKVLKDTNVSLWMRNLQLSALAIPAAVICIFVSDLDLVRSQGLLGGFTAWIWAAVALQAVGGLIIAVVIKYADNIVKSLASSLAIVVSVIGAIFLFHQIPGPLFGVGTLLVITAIIIYSYFPYRVKAQNEDADEERDPEKHDHIRRDPSNLGLVQQAKDKKPIEVNEITIAP